VKKGLYIDIAFGFANQGLQVVATVRLRELLCAIVLPCEQ
jgi:hypothetical protein